MKYAPSIAGGLLGMLVASAVPLFNAIPILMGLALGMKLDNWPPRELRDELASREAGN